MKKLSYVMMIILLAAYCYGASGEPIEADITALNGTLWEDTDSPGDLRGFFDGKTYFISEDDTEPGDGNPYTDTENGFLYIEAGPIVFLAGIIRIEGGTYECSGTCTMKTWAVVTFAFIPFMYTAREYMLIDENWNPEMHSV